MAKAGKTKHKPGGVDSEDVPEPKKATFRKNADKKNEVDEPKLRPSVGAAVTFSNEIRNDIVIVLWGRANVLLNDKGAPAGLPLSDKDFPRVLYLKGWNGVGDPPSLTFTATGDVGSECHYKVIVDFVNGDGDIGTNEKNKNFSGGQDPEIIIGG
jgi:hypothetical protein